MAKPAAKRVKVEKGADSEPAPTEAPAAAPVKQYRLVFVSYDEQLYKDLKAHQDKRVAKMQRKK